jgi:hypothetical protein
MGMGMGMNMGHFSLFGEGSGPGDSYYGQRHYGGGGMGCNEYDADADHYSNADEFELE